METADAAPKAEHLARLLVVDDNLEVLSMLRTELGLQGYEVLAFDRGKEALEAVEQESFDLALLDVMLLDVNGYELCRRIKGQPRTRWVPVMMLTALRDPKEKIKGLDNGADEFLNKPFQVEELLARVRALLRTAHLHKALEKSLQECARFQQLQSQLHRYVIHDLRGPMTSVIGALDLIAEGPDPETLKWLVSKSRGGCDAIMEMVMTLLDIDRMEHGELAFTMGKMDLAEVVRETLRQWLPVGETRHITVVADLPPRPVLMSGDRAYLKRALGNLLANALRYSPPRESVTVTVTDIPEAEAVELSVADRGPGVPKELAERVFEPGFSYGAGLKENQQRGFGLGLALCRIVAAGHGGSAWVEPRETQGARFVLRLSKAS